MDLSIPLDYLYPEVFGAIDKEEKDLICKLGALDLVLIENASDVATKTIQGGGYIEYILKSIVSSYKTGYVHLPSETFPFYLTPENKDTYFKDAFIDAGFDKANYIKLVKNYRKIIGNSKSKKIVTVLGLDLGEDGGHYAAFHYDKNVVSIFDSMQVENTKDDKNFKSIGYYTPYFIQLAGDLFPSAKIVVPDCIKSELSTQFTGGFGGNLPLAVSEAKGLAKRKQKLISIQATESQNHFCYMWSIWWIHLRVAGYSFQKVLDMLKTTDPLTVIKRYIWCVIHVLKIPLFDKRFKSFFEKHFLSIWSNYPLEDKLSIKFARYKLPAINPCINLSDALLHSINPIKLIPEPNTPVPKELCS